MKRSITPLLIALLICTLALSGCAQSAGSPAESPVNSPKPTHTPEPTQEPIPEPTPEPTVAHALVDFYGEPSEGYVAIDQEQAQKIVKDSAKKESESVTIPIYSEDELLLGKYADGEGAYNCTWPGFDNSNIYFSSSVSNDLSWILSVFPNAACRETDDGRTYLMYDTDKGSRIYLFFYPDNLNSVRGYSLISCKRISYSDISSIKSGDTIEDVMAVDPTAKFVKVMNDRITDASVENYAENWGQPITTVHLLTDGIMKITYERSGEEGDYRYTVTDIEYHENFELDGIAGVTNYSIAETDYVDNE